MSREWADCLKVVISLSVVLAKLTEDGKLRLAMVITNMVNSLYDNNTICNRQLVLLSYKELTHGTGLASMGPSDEWSFFLLSNERVFFSSWKSL